MPGFLTDDDYAKYNTRTDESGATITAKAPSGGASFSDVGGGIIVTPDDPRWPALAAKTGAKPGEKIRVIALTPEIKNAPGMFHDPSKLVDVGDGGIAVAESNLTEEFKKPENEGFDYAKIVSIPLMAVGAGFATGALGAGAAGAEMGAGAAAGAEAGAGAAGAAGAEGAGAFGGYLSPIASPAMPAMLGPEAMATYTGGAVGTGTAAGGLASLGETGATGATGLTALDPIATPTMPSMLGTSDMATFTGAGGNSLFDTAGSWLKNNPGQAVKLGMGLASLGAAGSSGGGSGGGATDAGSIIEQMANANRVNQNTPLGSRNWVKGPDGRWTVNDTMNPNEQKNFEQVQGMNNDVTGMAKQRLAAMLAAPPKQRYDRPITFGGNIIGG